MIQAGENLALGPQAHPKAGVNCCAVNDLDRDLRRVLAIRTLTEIDRTRSTVTEYLSQPVVTHHLSQKSLASVSSGYIEGCTERVGQRRGSSTIVERQHGQNFIAQLRIIWGLCEDERRLFFLRQHRCFVEESFHASECGIYPGALGRDAHAVLVI